MKLPVIHASSHAIHPTSLDAGSFRLRKSLVKPAREDQLDLSLSRSHCITEEELEAEGDDGELDGEHEPMRVQFVSDDEIMVPGRAESQTSMKIQFA